MRPALVLHLLGTAQPEGQGIARLVGSLAAQLDPSKYELHAWFLGPPGPLLNDLQAAGASVRSIEWWRGARDPAGAYRFWCLLKKHDFAIVHQHFGARSIRRIVRLCSDAKLVVHVHGKVTEGNAEENPIAIRDADLVIAVSRAVARQFPHANPRIVLPGVETRNKITAQNLTQEPDSVIGAASRLVPLKGLIDLIRAVAVLREEFSTLKLEIAGEGPARLDLENEVERLGLASHVRFLGWLTDLAPKFRSWDIFAMPSLEEGFGMAALEAMAEGLPVVATSVGGLPEIVDDGQTGYIVPPSDVVELSRCLRLLIVNPKARRAMGDAGRRRAMDFFSLNRMVEEVSAIYDSLLQKAHRE